MAKKTEIVPSRALRDPFALLSQLTSVLDHTFGEPFGLSRWPAFQSEAADAATWAPKVDVFEKDGRLVTRVDLPGVKKDDVRVEVTDGHLALSGERKHEAEEKKDNVYRTEREYGSFYRVVPLPDGVKLEDVKATFADGVLEVSAPLPTKAANAVRRVAIEEPDKAAKSAA